MKRLRMAIIGAGQIAGKTHLPAYLSMEDVDLVGLCDSRTDIAQKLAEQFHIPSWYSDYRNMLTECRPDAVTICVPNKLHYSMTLDSLEAGCHVLCEKPPAMTALEAYTMERHAAEKNLLLSYGFHFRHSGQVAFLREAIQKGELGEIYAARIQWLRRRGIPGGGNFTKKELQGGGPLMDIGIHMLDTALYLMDYPDIAYVCASSSDRIGKRGGFGLMGEWSGTEYNVEDGLFGFVKFENGSCLNLETSFALNMKEKDLRNVILFGDKKGASVFPLELYGEEGGLQMNQSYPFLEIRDWHGDSNRNFVNACLGFEPLLVTAAQGTYIQKLVCALYESAETGKPVCIPQIV